MADPEENAPSEDQLLRSVAMQNAQSILLARRRAEQELLSAKEALERRTRELARSLALMGATLEATWDGILVTDEAGHPTTFNERFAEMWRLPRDLAGAMDRHPGPPGRPARGAAGLPRSHRRHPGHRPAREPRRAGARGRAGVRGVLPHPGGGRSRRRAGVDVPRYHRAPARRTGGPAGRRGATPAPGERAVRPRRSGARQLDEGRVPGHRVARAPDPAQRHSRLGAPAADRLA